MVFENGVKNIQAAAYNGARTVYKLYDFFVFQLSENGASMTDFGSLPNLRCLMTNDDNLIDGNEMHLLACSVYHSLLKHLPALVTPQLGQNNFEFPFEFNNELFSIQFDPVEKHLVKLYFQNLERTGYIDKESEAVL